MFLDRDTSGGDGLNTPPQSTITSIPTRQKSSTLSHTGNYERRVAIRAGGAKTLVRNHNSLLIGIIERGSISTHEKNILLSMEQEGIHSTGEFYGKIQENEGAHKTPHQEGMSRYNELQGVTHILRGATRLHMWSLVTKSTTS